MLNNNRYTQLLKRVVPVKPEGFVPHPSLYLTLLFSTFATVLLIPFAADTSSFMTVTVLSRLLPFSFLALPYVTPESWGISKLTQR